ncbi:MAG: C1 family peptidase, partial [Lachnospiraceae bacterium]|nr:C1 family peptidase [Lachnospiraceae bacterium]
MRKNGWVKWLVVAVSAAVALTIPGVRATAAPEQGTQGGSADDFVMPPLTYEEMPWDKDTPVLDPSVSVEEMAEMLGEGEDAADSGDSDSRYHEDRMQPILIDTSEAFPAHYNDRDTLTNYLNQNLPPIRSQSPFGSCWAHAAMGLAELYCIRTENQTTHLDYSESHLAHFNFCQGTTPILSGTGYDQSELDRFTTRIADFNDAHRLNRGGNMAIAAETLMRRRGIALEDSFPYPLTEEAANNQTWENAEFADEVCLTDCYYINIRDNRDMAKYWISKHGGLGVSFCATDSLSGSSEAYYNVEHNAFYNYNASQTNHAVIAVGWDDTFPKEYFDAGEHKPANDGAWLIRNSWGDGNGNNLFAFQKYFWMSYE